MLTDEVMDMLFNHNYMREFDMEDQSRIIQIFEDVVINMNRRNRYAAISELLDE